MNTAEKRSAEEVPEAVKKAKTAEDEEENIEEEEDDLDEEGEEGEEGEDEEGGEDDGEEGEGEGEEGEDDDDEEGEEEEAAEEEDTPAADMSAALSVAMLKAYKEGLGVDFTLVCQGVVKNVHSQVIMARSPYLVNRWSEEKKKELIIEDCDPTTFEIIVEYMYGIAIPDSVLINTTASTDEDSSPTPAKKLKVDLMQNTKILAKLLEMSDKLLMADLKDEVEGLLIKAIESPKYLSASSVCQFLVIVELAEKLSCDKLLAACAKVMGPAMRTLVDLGVADQDLLTRICTRVIERTPKFAAQLLVALIHPDLTA